jgi:hypothetical protein
MKKSLFYILTSTVMVLLTGCGTSGSTVVQAQGWHFQGRDCLACHNVDLQEQKNLLYGGTVYKDFNVTNRDDLNTVCGGDLLVNFLDATTLVDTYSSKNYVDPTSKGNNGKGNIFILKRLLSSSYGSYYMQITDKNGSVFATSATPHNFNAQNYDINNPVNLDNRISCNACHIEGGVGLHPLYVQTNKNLCQ